MNLKSIRSIYEEYDPYNPSDEELEWLDSYKPKLNWLTLIMGFIIPLTLIMIVIASSCYSGVE